MNAFDDGSFYVTTLGRFVGLLIDAGQDVAVRFRVVEEGERDEQGRYTRRMDCTLIPDGHVEESIAVGDGVHKTLLDLLKAGVVS